MPILSRERLFLKYIREPPEENSTPQCDIFGDVIQACPGSINFSWLSPKRVIL
jgi:hypothetical protein